MSSVPDTLRSSIHQLSQHITDRSLSTRRIAVIAFLLNLQGMVVVLYLGLSGSTITQPRYFAYGLIWVNVGVYLILKTSPPAADFPTRRRAVAVAAGYFALLAVFGGLIGTGAGINATGARIAWLPPGWGPAIVYSGYYFKLTLMPAYVVGYAALSYLMFTTVIEASGSAVAGVVGLFSCVSCSWPIIGFITSSFLGGSGVLIGSALDMSYDLSMVIFLATALLLYWRPGFR